MNDQEIIESITTEVHINLSTIPRIPFTTITVHTLNHNYMIGAYDHEEISLDINRFIGMSIADACIDLWNLTQNHNKLKDLITKEQINE